MASTAESDVNSYAGTLDLTGDDPEHIERDNAATGNHPDSSRRYGGPQIQQYKFPIVGCIVTFALIIVAIAVSAVSFEKSNEALAHAMANIEAIESEKFTIINKGNEAESDSGGVTPSAPKDSIAPDPTPNPTPKPTTAKSTDAPTEPHPFNPQWFQTTHEDYQQRLDLNEQAEASEGNGMHTYTLAASFCTEQKLWLCGYDSYCPNGQGSNPFNGGPPKAPNSNTLEETQWAPFYTGDHSEVAAGKNWVQIGLIPASEEGTVENGFGKCSTYDDWYSGVGEDIEDSKWEEEHRMWILCCEKAEEGEETRERGR
eukprot:CAMPEP_0172302862 /NCGR_PEP_ID=MMETSP1058-20130122/4506_1 /TAXON_ID=83371 /ORGANISM="Detonula confervacea, Strain CCMP 353" /LENGTH=313 /DNA_ID=CAMNT_0013013505 /DNA_START=41 /DNA_END=982 /DNA_ORIENTATION=+